MPRAGVRQLEIRRIRNSDDVEIRIRYFEYDVASIEMQLPFSSSWRELASLASRWIMSPDMEGVAASLLRKALQHTGPASIFS